MIIGPCPYCDCPMWNPLADDRPLPCWERVTCEGCGGTVWLLHSRVNPQAYSQEAFDAEFEIDEATKTIRPKKPKEDNHGEETKASQTR